MLSIHMPYIMRYERIAYYNDVFNGGSDIPPYYVCGFLSPRWERWVRETGYCMGCEYSDCQWLNSNYSLYAILFRKLTESAQADGARHYITFQSVLATDDDEPRSLIRHEAYRLLLYQYLEQDPTNTRATRRADGAIVDHHALNSNGCGNWYTYISRWSSGFNRIAAQFPRLRASPCLVSSHAVVATSTVIRWMNGDRSTGRVKLRPVMCLWCDWYDSGDESFVIWRGRVRTMTRTHTTYIAVQL